MTQQRPGVRRVNEGRQLLDNLVFDETPFVEDIEAAKAYALLGIGEALGEIALTLRQLTPAPITNTPPPNGDPDDRR